jgi:uncharacterized protein (PEP-CTERM system associated)
MQSVVSPPRSWLVVAGIASGMFLMFAWASEAGAQLLDPPERPLDTNQGARGRDSDSPILGTASLGSGLAVLGLRVPDDTIGARWVATPSLGLRVMATDNVFRTTGAAKRSEVFLEALPGLVLRGASRALRLDLSYLGLVAKPVNDSTATQKSNTFRGIASLEALERLLYLDVSGSVSQQYRSSFAPRQSEVAANDANRIENRAASVSPYIRTTSGAGNRYQLQYSYAWMEPSAENVELPTRSIHQLTAQYVGRPTSVVGVGLDYGGMQTELESLQKPRIHQRYFGTVSLLVDPELMVFAQLGEERNNYLLDKEISSTIGGGVSWIPSSRTRLVAKGERRVFGTGYFITFGHRHRQLAASFNMSRDIVITPNQPFAIPAGEARPLLNEALLSAYPDPVQRSNAVEQIIAQNGIAGVSAVPLSIFTQRVLVQKQIAPSLALIGVQNTVVIDFQLLDSEPLEDNPLPSIGDDFSLTKRVRQTRTSLNWAHRLTALSSLATRLSRSTTQSLDSAEERKTTQSELSMTVAKRFGQKTTAQMGLRMVRFERTPNLGVGFVERVAFTGVAHTF